MKFPSTRLRRNRKSEWSRRLINDTYLDKSDFILPIFVCEGKNKKQEIKSMPGIFRYSIDRLDEIISRSSKNEIPAVAIFPLIENSKKNNKGTEALNKNNVVCNAIHQVKKLNKNIGVMCDVALDPYTSHGHDGLIINNEIDNDETNKILIKQALIQAQAGCDIIAPSDMMDGRIGLIRNALEKNKFINVQILSYAVKYASNFYSPFRDAVGTSSTLKSDKKTYQMDYKNSDEALLEVKLDLDEGADFVMVKPALAYLDIIYKIKQKFNVPVFAYNVSGEYSLIKNGIKSSLA
ncbi:MAG: porphobilinogen synthase, partial [Pseudomonadota bacterium]